MGIFFWFALMLVFLIFEACTLGLTTIWFAGGAMVTAILSLWIDTLWVQLLVFALVSGLCLYLLRPLLADRLNSKFPKTNADSLIGKVGKTVTKIDNLNGTGEVVIKGQPWTALSVSDKQVIETDTLVTIKEIRGNKLIVEEVKED